MCNTELMLLLGFFECISVVVLIVLNPLGL